MAALPQSLAETGRRSSSSSRNKAPLSHGRGGAGMSPSLSPPHPKTSSLHPQSLPPVKPQKSRNIKLGNWIADSELAKGNINSTPSDSDPVTLETPTLKGEMYTTGRGGSGNMARNDDPEAARRAQDVIGFVSPKSPPFPFPPHLITPTSLSYTNFPALPHPTMPNKIR